MSDAVLGMVGFNSGPADSKLLNVRVGYQRLNPNGDYTLTGLTSQMKSEKIVNDPVFNY
jgi:hypothetical protein